MNESPQWRNMQLPASDAPAPPSSPPQSGQSAYPGGQGWDPQLGAEDPFGQGPGSPTLDEFGTPQPPPQAPKAPWWRRGVMLVRLGIAAVVAISLIVGWLGSARRDGSGEISRSGTLAVTDLRVGDCFDNPDQVEVTDVAALPCTEPHDYEIFHVTELGIATFPTDTELLAAVEAQCLPVFQTYVGVAYADSQLDVNWVSPTQGSWDDGDRAMSCFALNTDGSKLTASVRGSNR